MVNQQNITLEQNLSSIKSRALSSFSSKQTFISVDVTFLVDLFINFIAIYLDPPEFNLDVYVWGKFGVPLSVNHVF